jgi:hypothetical protein
MILSGFISKREVIVEDLHLEDAYKSTIFEVDKETKNIIAKLQDEENNCLAQLNIERRGNSDEASMDHAKGVAQRWLKNHCKKVIRKGYKYILYTSPDGKEGSYGYFMREVDKGYLHGLTYRV